MKDKLEPNMYVRTKRGTFDRFMTSKKIESLIWYTFEDRGSITNPENYIIKASHNIINLIEEGDYVNGEKVIRIDKDPFIKGQINLWTNTITSNYWGDISLSRIIEKDIKSIVTKEMFSSMEYRLGDDE